MPAANGRPVSAVLDRLRNVQPKQVGGWEALCPAHDDARRSLSVAEGNDGTVLLHCHAGCTAEQIVAAIELSMRDLFPSTNGRNRGSFHIVATYDYTDENGALLYQVCRLEPKDFKQRRPGPDGGWVWNLNGVHRVLYHLPELLAAPPDMTVWIVEGEKDADTLREHELLATTNSEGAGKWNKGNYAETLRGRPVVVVPDNDEPGRRHASDIVLSLRGVAASVTILELPGLPEKGDVSDWLQAGGTASKLYELLEQAKQTREAEAPAPSESVATAHETRVEAPAATSADVHLTDLGNARRVVARHGQDLRFCHPTKNWHVWDGCRWPEDSTAEIVRRVKETQGFLHRGIARQIATLGDAGDDEERKTELAKLTKLLKHALAWEDTRTIVRCITSMASEPGIPILPEQFDADNLLLNVLNGTIDLRTGQLREHRRADLITKLAPVEYKPDAICPLWERCLRRWMDNNDDLIGYLQRIVGYCLTGIVTEHAWWLFHGRGANGKSTFLGTILDLLGDYAMTAESELLLQKKHEAHSTERADLFKKRFVFAAEVDEGKQMAEALMKKLTGGEHVRARKCHKDNIEFDPTHKIMLAANHKPTIRGTDYAVWRRIKFVPFVVTISDEEKDSKLGEKLKAEYAGILAWAIRGCLDWQEYGLDEPNEVKQATMQYQNEQDAVAGFVAECCFTHATARFQVSKLFAAYQEWSRGQDYHATRVHHEDGGEGFSVRKRHGQQEFLRRHRDGEFRI
jgi:putative DNA primase/helicase